MPDSGGIGSQVIVTSQSQVIVTFARRGQHMTQKTVNNKKSKAGVFDWTGADQGDDRL